MINPNCGFEKLVTLFEFRKGQIMGINEFIGHTGSAKHDLINVSNPKPVSLKNTKKAKIKYKPCNSAAETAYSGFMSIFIISSSREVLHSSKNSRHLQTKDVIQFNGKGRLELKDHRANDTLIKYLRRMKKEGFIANAPIVWTNNSTQIKHSCSLIPVEASAITNTPIDDRRKSNAPFVCLVFEALGTNVRLCHLELQENFALTKAEIDLAKGLFIGKDILQIAEQNGITKNTVRERLKNVFLKTNTNRQATLVRMLHLFAK